MPSAATTVALVLTWLVALGIAGIGVSGLLTPRTGAGFGIPGTRIDQLSVRSWLAVKADRDIGTGLFVVIALLGGGHQLTGWMMLLGALMPLCDALVVRRSGGPATSYLAVHGATAAVMVVAGAVLLLS
jgi:hypothetical protein